jgi:hypothetical protein
MRLIYFDFDHGTARELTIELDRPTRSLHFHFERGPDPTYDEDNVGVDSIIVDATVMCPDLPQFDGFVRALVAAMRETPFSLQDPNQPYFNAMPHDALHLEGISGGVSPEHLTNRIPAEIVLELLSPHYHSAIFKPLISIPKQWKPDQFWYESDEHGIKRTLRVKLDEEALTIEFESHQEGGRGSSEGDVEERTVSATLRCPDLAQMHGMLHALAKAMCDAGCYPSAYVLGEYAGKQGGRRYRPAKIALDQVAEICLKYMPAGLNPDQLKVRIPSEIVPELIPPQVLKTGQIPVAWIPLV